MHLALDPSRAARAVVGAAIAAALIGAPAASADDPIWRLEQPAPPPGAQFKVPLGAPGDLQFWSHNRGLLAVEGNETVSRGLYLWNGEKWRQLSTVCGGESDTTRIAWAGPSEFWTISAPSKPRFGNGTALCHFKDGRVEASYSTPDQARDPYRQMAAATCKTPNDCWFGGFAEQSPTGERRGGFHLHWDGARLTTVYAPQGRGVSDIDVHQGLFVETLVRGGRPGSTTPADLAQPEQTPRLLHNIADGVFSNDLFVPVSDPDGTDLLALDSDGTQLWWAGGGAASGPELREDGGPPAHEAGNFPRQPLAASLAGEVPIAPGLFSDDDRFVDIAAVPETSAAWVAVQRYDQRASTNVKARVALLDANGIQHVDSLPTSGAGRGSAARIAFTAFNDGWLVTTAGWLFHYTDGSSAGLDTDPAFQGTIGFRPNEAAEQFVPDTPPPDDSGLLQPPPVIVEPTPPPPTPAPEALVKSLKTKLRGKVLYVSFRLTRKAKVQLVARRRTKVVAKTKNKLMRPGKQTLKLKLNPKKWPTRLQFKTVEPGVEDDTGGDDENTITTPGRRQP